MISNQMLITLKINSVMIVSISFYLFCKNVQELFLYPGVSDIVHCFVYRHILQNDAFTQAICGGIYRLLFTKVLPIKCFIPKTSLNY